MRCGPTIVTLLCCCFLGGTVFAGDSSAAAPIAKITKEIYVANSVPKKAPWLFVYPGKDGYREEIQTVWSHEGQVSSYGDSSRELRLL